MNACLLKIAADETAELAAMAGRTEDQETALGISRDVAGNVQEHAWKTDYFARCLMNDDREGGFTYLGASGDGLAMEPGASGTYFLNSYSWPILAGIAREDQIRAMLAVVKKHLATDAGLRLCTLVDFDRLGVETGTALYFPGDRENCGVFKHAAMMAVVASLQAAKTVEDEALASDLRDLAFYMIDKTLPYKTLDNPYVLKGNPRFCTQYNNSETGENIGPMLSGTASWLTLAMYEIFGAEVGKESIRFCPILRDGAAEEAFTLSLGEVRIHVRIKGRPGCFRPGQDSIYRFGGQESGCEIRRPLSGDHQMEIIL